MKVVCVLLLLLFVSNAVAADLDSKDLRKPQATLSIDGKSVEIRYLPCKAFGGSWKSGKNAEVNQSLFEKYSKRAQTLLDVTLGEKEGVAMDNDFLVWTVKVQK